MFNANDKGATNHVSPPQRPRLLDDGLTLPPCYSFSVSASSILIAGYRGLGRYRSVETTRQKKSMTLCERFQANGRRNGRERGLYLDCRAVRLAGGREQENRQ
jgi:hypothetical protein